MLEGLIEIVSSVPVFNWVTLVIVMLTFVALIKVKRDNLTLRNQVAQLSNQFRAMNSGHLGMGREIRKVVKEIAHVESVQQESHASATDARAYDQAGVLLARGATIEEVVEACDISPAEAELLAIVRNTAPSHRHTVNA
ncbi:DUF2802 domain-containing protein [Aliikangiella marina]|uniref:DUF2802 domain-containing protein n=1 Tax=Aliikangiella marina TaxID=1712262 RepID=A0A545TEH9_9GAMM|nr:DUF2802 domain-containing protein [Aliikangiella marina]TQV75576.1 DUF2802 domain-containing protein [Aliikangiella marina]